MHILILPMYYPEKDSSPHRGYMFFEQAMQLAKSGCKVGLAFTEQRPLKNFTWKRFRKESHFQISAEDNGSFVTMRLHAWNPKLSTRAGGIIWSLLTVLLVRKYIRTYGRPDLIHAHFGTWAGYAARLVYKWYKVPYVITEHASSINGNQTTPSQAVILKKAYSEARKIICVGTKLKRSLCAYVSDPDKVTVIPNFVDTNTFAFSPHRTEKKKHFTFISIGNLNKRKGGFADCFSLGIQGYAARLFDHCWRRGRNAATQKVNSVSPPARAGKTDRPPVTGRIVRVAGYLRCFCTGLLCGDIRHRIHRSNGNRLARHRHHMRRTGGHHHSRKRLPHPTGRCGCARR